MKKIIAIFVLFISTFSRAQGTEQVIDIPTRPNVTNRVLFIKSKLPTAKATILLMAGGNGGVQIFSGGSIKGLAGNFLVRSRQVFSENGMNVVIVDAPSDRQTPPFLAGFRQSSEHAADLASVIKWAKETTKLPVWVVGTSNGTYSAAQAGIQLQGDEGPDGLILTSTVLNRDGNAVTDMPLGRIVKPVLVLHHKNDACKYCNFEEIPKLMTKLSSSSRVELITVDGGQAKGDPCEGFHFHGFNGIEADVVKKLLLGSSNLPLV